MQRSLPDDVARAIVAAREIVNHRTSRAAIGVAITDVTAMAHALCALHDAAKHGAAFLIARENDLTASNESTSAEVLERAGALHDEALIAFADDLVALGVLALSPESTLAQPEPTDERTA